MYISLDSDEWWKTASDKSLVYLQSTRGRGSGCSVYGGLAQGTEFFFIQHSDLYVLIFNLFIRFFLELFTLQSTYQYVYTHALFAMIAIASGRYLT